jgi:hypothetical protein
MGGIGPKPSDLTERGCAWRLSKAAPFGRRCLWMIDWVVDSENIVAGQRDRSLAAGLDDVENVTLRLLLGASAKSRSRLDAELHESVIPEVAQRLAARARSRPFQEGQ